MDKKQLDIPFCSTKHAEFFLMQVFAQTYSEMNVQSIKYLMW